MEQKFCQSCGMPLTADLLGTNADGSRNMDYCIFCYKDGRLYSNQCKLPKWATVLGVVLLAFGIVAAGSDFFSFDRSSIA